MAPRPVWQVGLTHVKHAAGEYVSARVLPRCSRTVSRIRGAGLLARRAPGGRTKRSDTIASDASACDCRRRDALVGRQVVRLITAHHDVDRPRQPPPRSSRRRDTDPGRIDVRKTVERQYSIPNEMCAVTHGEDGLAFPGRTSPGSPTSTSTTPGAWPTTSAIRPSTAHSTRCLARDIDAVLIAVASSAHLEAIPTAASAGRLFGSALRECLED